ncbi:neuromedin-U isoform X2 [Lepisosteus oculatus]|uniref:neuromedin-U isoform X2 n=1 Tax=Lepisosteus oculatus TaxID=7918 RepID=UPI00073FC4E9|nr:PREDICTED: neuromedin-U isoform X2 [Lepisosteus oculatus]
MPMKPAPCPHQPAPGSCTAGCGARAGAGRQPHCAAVLTLAVLLLALPACRSAPALLQGPQADQELQLWSEIDDLCSSYLSADLQSQAPSVLEELCYSVMGIVHKSQDVRAKEQSKRSSVLHPLLQLVPQLHARRLRRFRSDDDLQGPGGIQSRGYFLFRPRNGRRSTTFI